MTAAEDIQFSFADGLPQARHALSYAVKRHGDQQRDGDRATFIAHPVEVASLLARLQYPDHVVGAAILHDVLEDTDAERSELERQFGPQVARLVALVSDDPRIDDEERQKSEVRARVRQAGGEALAVYAADKISKVRELRMLIAGGLPRDQAATKLRRYEASFAMLEAAPTDPHLLELLRFELESLQQLPPHPHG